MDNTKSNALHVKSVDDLGDLQVRAVISAPVVDREGEIIDSQTMQFKTTSDGEIAVPLVIDHEYRTRNVVGHVVEQYLNELGEREAVIQYARTNDGIESYIKVADGHMKNPYSIGYTYSPDNVKDNTFFGVMVHELSQVVNAANQNSRLVKAYKSLDEQTRSAINAEYVHKAYEVDDEGTTKFIYQDYCFCTKCEDIRSTETEEVIMSDATEVKETEETTDVVEETVQEVVEQATETAPEEVPAEVEEVQEEEKEETKMSETLTKDSIKEMLAEVLAAQKDAEVAEEVAEEAAEEVVEEVTEEAEKSDHRVATYRQLNALAKGDFETVNRFNLKHAKEMGLITKNEDLVMNAADFGDAILCEQVFADVYECNERYGVVSQLVGRDTLTTSNKAKYISKTGNMDFDLIANCSPKPVKQMALSAETADVYEAALVTVWCNTDAEDLIFSWYDMLIAEVSDAVRRLEDTIVLTWDGSGINGTDPDPTIATGLLVNPEIPTLDTTAAEFSIAVLDAACQLAVCAREDAVLVMNFCTYVAKHKAIGSDCCEAKVDQSGNFGRRFASFYGYPVVISEALADGQILMGDFNQYRLITKGGLSIDQSGSATIQLDPADPTCTWNTFQNNSTAMRASLRIGGYVRNPNAFVLINCA